MSEQIKIAQEEMAEINMLREKISKNIFDFGSLAIEKIELDKMVSDYVERDKKLREDRANLEKMEKEFVDKLVKKYGEGEIDLKNGVFIKNPQTS